MSKKQNILFLMTDQQRYDALGIHNPIIKTPNLDKLANEGILFSEAICNSPMCVPSRNSMMTGVYPSQLGVRHNMQMWSRDEQLPTKPFAQYLKDAGYYTLCFGKTHWYIGTYDIPASISNVKPSSRGFDVVWEFKERSENTCPIAKVYSEECVDGQKLFDQEKMITQKGGEDVTGYIGQTSKVPAKLHKGAWLTDGAIDYIENRSQHDDPFFLYLSIVEPHAPSNCPKEFEDLYDIDDITETELPPPTWEIYEHTTPWRHREAWSKLDEVTKRRAVLRYYALCSFADYQFGRVLQALKDSGEYDDTTIIFTSDHGESLGERYRFSKYSLYESSVRVPLIIANKTITESKSGSIDTRPAELVDILPTLLDIAEEDTPSYLSGRSLLKDPCRQGQFAEFHGSGYHEEQYGPKYMWRANGFKLILNMPGKVTDALTRLDDTIGELYDLNNDKLEINNLYNDPCYLELREKMTRDLLMHVAINYAKFPYGITTTKV